MTDWCLPSCDSCSCAHVPGRLTCVALSKCGARHTCHYNRIRTYWPGLRDGTLAPDYSGIRPKLTGPGEAQADFLIDAPAQHGLPGLVQMLGIEFAGADLVALVG